MAAVPGTLTDSHWLWRPARFPPPQPSTLEKWPNGVYGALTPLGRIGTQRRYPGSLAGGANGLPALYSRAFAALECGITLSSTVESG